jgi:hypothetical protein
MQPLLPKDMVENSSKYTHLAKRSIADHDLVNEGAEAPFTPKQSELDMAVGDPPAMARDDIFERTSAPQRQYGRLTPGDTKENK